MESKENKKKLEDNFETKIQKIIDTFTKAEKLGKENSKKYKDWIKDISDPNFKLIKNLLTYFCDELTTTAMRENIFKIIRKLYFLNEKVIAPQIFGNQEFVKAIVIHITAADQSKISDNCFYLLTHLFNEKTFKPAIDEKFIEALFNGLSIIKEEDILNDVVKILIEINSNFKEGEENIFVKVHTNNDNARVYDEILLRVLNNETDDAKQIRILKCLNDLMVNQTKSIFYESDLEIFIDIILSKFQMTDNVELMKKLLTSLDKVTQYDEYYRNTYKMEDITELLEDLQSADSQPEEIKELSKKIVINLTDKQGKKKEGEEQA